MSRSVRAIEAEIEQLTAELITAKAAGLPEPNVKFMAFKAQHEPDSTTYEYVAIRLEAGHWAVTGGTDAKFPNWSAFMGWLLSLHSVSMFQTLYRSGPELVIK